MVRIHRCFLICVANLRKEETRHLWFRRKLIVSTQETRVKELSLLLHNFDEPWISRRFLLTTKTTKTLEASSSSKKTKDTDFPIKMSRQVKIIERAGWDPTLVMGRILHPGNKIRYILIYTYKIFHDLVFFWKLETCLIRNFLLEIP
jgi:hypothetical protein